MGKELTGMIEAQAKAEIAFSFTAERFGPVPISAAREVAGMKAALLWLADNVSDEMLEAFNKAKGITRRVAWEDGQTILAISAALRAAAGSAPTTPEVK